MISVVLFTYNRPDYARRTLEVAGANLHSTHPIWCHIADDGSPQSQRDDLVEIAHGYFGDRVSVSDSDRRGYGGSYNLATQYVHEHSEIILPLEDDWELQRPLDLDPLVTALADPRINCIRMGYLGFTQPLLGVTIQAAGQTFLLLDPASPEPHVFSGHPRLETRDFQRKMGPWPENMAAGETEFEVAHRTNSRTGVVWPLDLCYSWGNLWAHIGTVPSESPTVRGDLEAVG